MSTVFHPQTRGQTEHMKCFVEMRLRRFVSPTMTNWDELLVLAQFYVNRAWQESVHNAPLVPQSRPSSQNTCERLA